jgi:hypothetical protein
MAKESAATAAPKVDKNSLPYLIMTPIDVLIDDGIQFEGATEKDKMLNHTDFLRLRELVQRFDPQLTGDIRETIFRTIRCCVKPFVGE